MKEATKPRKRSAYAPVAVAVQDVLWMAVLLPLGAAFCVVLALARGYYAARRKGTGWALGYSLAVLAGLTWLCMRVVGGRNDRRGKR